MLLRFIANAYVYVSGCKQILTVMLILVFTFKDYGPIFTARRNA